MDKKLLKRQMTTSASLTVACIIMTLITLYYDLHTYAVTFCCFAGVQCLLLILWVIRYHNAVKKSKHRS